MKRVIVILLIVFTWSGAMSQEFSFDGQASGWGAVQPFNTLQYQGGARCLPERNLSDTIFKGHQLTARVSATGSITHTYPNPDYDTKYSLKPYRGWIRYSTPQLEVRAGLQKIAFGPATMLRPLMWFDRLDPRDPLQITDGVYGVLGRYYFLNNANIWLWGLYGNESTKGWEYIASKKQRPEFGGRVQLPVPAGEVALSYHNRVMDYATDTTGFFPGLGEVNEQKFALDGRWDTFVGLWFEAVTAHQQQDILPSWTSQLNIGVDYTFGLGNGLHVTHEALFAGASEKFAGEGTYTAFSAMSAAYPISLSDNATIMVYYDYKNNDWYRFLNLQHSWTNLSAMLMLYWNPDNFNLYGNMPEAAIYTGTGFQIMLIYNH
ncbi:MAG: hypothetical protein PHU97_04375 [Bacteroidales bacterium]|nr:hypothetical protein [Bacteroidales bacterium]